MPVIVRPVEWKSAPFAKLRVVPTKAKPVTLWKSRDPAWLDVAEGIRRAVHELTDRLPTQSPKPDGPSPDGTPPPTPPGPPSPACGHPSRAIYDATGEYKLRSHIVRTEGDPPGSDAAVDVTYDALGAFYEFFWQVYGRHSIDDAGRSLDATVHYGVDYDNVFWNGESLVVRDGSVFVGLTAEDSDWLFAAGGLGPQYPGMALASLAAPGTAYDHRRDPEPRLLPARDAPRRLRVGACRPHLVRDAARQAPAACRPLRRVRVGHGGHGGRVVRRGLEGARGGASRVG